MYDKIHYKLKKKEELKKKKDVLICKYSKLPEKWWYNIVRKK